MKSEKDRKAVVLLSGGMDSAVCMGFAREEGYSLYPLTINYGQRNHFEIDAAKKISRYFDAEEHMVMDVNLRRIGGSALTGDIDVPHKDVTDGVPVTYVPGRNLIFLSIGVSWAEVLGADAIYIGANILDYSGYPDCREEFLNSFEKSACLGTQKSTSIEIKAPLLKMSKAEIVNQGYRFDIDFSMTVSCYDPDMSGKPCGECESCRIRARGLAESKRVS
ncbi:7-cyano-7-deazaguanine synthase QueC [Elusimicrobiota bacterium]